MIKQQFPQVNTGSVINLQYGSLYSKIDLNNLSNVKINGNGAIISGFNEYTEGQALSYEPEVITRNGNLLEYSKGDKGEFYIYRPIDARWYIFRALSSAMTSQFMSNNGITGKGGIKVNDINTVTDSSYAFDRKNKKLVLSDYDNILYSSDGEGIEINDCENILIENVVFEGFNRRCIHTNGGKQITFKNCTFRFTGWDGVNGENTSELNFIDCIIYDTLGNAILTSNNHNGKYQGNKMFRIGMQAGRGEMSQKETNLYINWDAACGIRHQGGDNAEFSLNEVSNTQYNGIGIWYCNNAHAFGNKILNSNLIVDDGGGIYAWGNKKTNTPFQNFLIENNIVINSKGTIELLDGSGERSLDATGIYMDDECSNGTLIGNIVLTSTRCIFIHNSDKIKIQDNILNGDAGILMRNNASSRYIYGGEIIGNKIDVKGFIYKLWSQADNINIWDRIRNLIDNNEFVWKTGNYIEVNSSSNVRNYNSLTSWQSAYGQDLNSKIIDSLPDLPEPTEEQPPVEIPPIPDETPIPTPEPIPVPRDKDFDFIQNDYVVYRDGIEISRHRNDANLWQKMIEVKKDYPNSIVTYKTEGRIE